MFLHQAFSKADIQSCPELKINGVAEQAKMRYDAIPVLTEAPSAAKLGTPKKAGIH